MNKLTGVLVGVLILLIVLAGYVGTQFPKFARGAVSAVTPAYWGYPCPTPIKWGYSSAPGYQGTPQGMQAVEAQAVASPTSEFLQIPENVAWMIADASRNYYGERIGTLAEADADNLFWQGGHTFEMGAQITKRHTLGMSQGAWDYMVFAEGIVVQKQGDSRIGILSPHGRWSSYAPPLVPTVTQ